MSDVLILVHFGLKEKACIHPMTDVFWLRQPMTASFSPNPASDLPEGYLLPTSIACQYLD
jgi:hypothetical protein